MSGSWTPPTATERLRLMRRVRTVAMVGASADTSRASYFVATYLLSTAREWEVWFVNPKGGEILGRPVYKSLDALPGPPDLVDVFRRSDDLPQVAEEAIAAGASALWLQLGLHRDDVAQRAFDAGLDVVTDRCLKIEHARFGGGLHLAGFDTGVIDARRRHR